MKRTLREKRFEAPDEELDFKSIIVREVTLRDEIAADEWAQEMAPKSLHMNPVGMMSFESRELIRASIVSVNDTAVSYPYMDIDDWSVRSWRFLSKAYSDLNGADADELKKFEGKSLLPSHQQTHDSDGQSATFSDRGAES